MATATQPIAPIYTLAALIDAAADAAKTRHEARASGRPLGAVTPIPKLTAALGSAMAPGVHIIHGSPGSGKTAFALQTACECGCPALFVTCEMSPLELLYRITSRVTGTYLQRFKTGELSPEKARQEFNSAALATPSLAILDATRTAVTPTDLLEQAQALRDKAREDGHEHFLLVIDSVHSWANGLPSDASEYDTLNIALDSLRQITANLECPALCIAERNRASKDSGGQAASAGTRRFEYGAESVIELHRDMSAAADANAEYSGDIAVTVKVSKNRHGTLTAGIKTLFNGRTQAFREAE